MRGRTISLRIDEPTLVQLDKVTREQGITRSAFLRDALVQAVRQHRIKMLERQHEEGYARYPVQPGEFDSKEDGQAWGAA